MSKILRLSASIILCGVVLLGCSPAKLYPGPDLPSDTLSKIEIRSAGASLYPRQIDGQTLSPGTRVAFVMPGFHRVSGTLEVTAYITSDYVAERAGECQVHFRAAAGRTYRVNVEGSYRLSQGWLTVVELPEGRTIGRKACSLTTY